MAKKKKKKEKVTGLEPLQYEYLCPACSKTAVKSSNKMLDVQIICESCEKSIMLDDEKRYKKLKKKIDR